MDIALANVLTADMVNRLTFAEDFFLAANEFDGQREFKEEYLYALKAAVARRIPYESDEWRLEAQEFIALKRLE